MAHNVIPTSFESWKHCITVLCGIKLSSEYVNERLKDLKEQNDDYTKRFITLYGHDHYHQVIIWFERYKAENFG